VFVAQFLTVGGDPSRTTETGTLTVSAPEGTSVVKSFTVRFPDGSNQPVSLSCGPTDASGSASCDYTITGRLYAGAPVTNVFTLADGTTFTTTGTSFCNNPTPTGEVCQ
jgi:hypothetical protein